MSVRISWVALFVMVAPAFGQEQFPSELVRFDPTSVKTVFQGAPQQWDRRIRERGWILRDGDVWKLWYTGYDATPTGRRQLGYATSKDGIRWERHRLNPLHPDTWIEDMQVVRDGERYVMVAEGVKDRAHWFTSTDGIVWKRMGSIDIRKTNGERIADGAYGTPTLFRHEGKWYLFYERGDRGIWLATSKDLQTWQHVQDEAVIVPGPGAYDRDQVAMNQVIHYQGRFYAYYHGAALTGPQANLWSSAIAVSDDLIHWKKYAQNPLMPVEKNVSSGIVIPDGKRFLFYTMHPEIKRYEPLK